MTASRHPMPPAATDASISTSAEARQNHVYSVGELGHIYAYSIYPRSRLAPVRAMLQISQTGEPITTVVNGERFRTTAHLTRPTWLEVDSGEVPVVCFVFYTYSEMFRSIRLLASPFIALSRELFRPFDRELRAAITGNLLRDDARKLFSNIIDVLCELLPPAPATDPRIEKVMSLLLKDSNIPVKQLAAAVSLSPDRLSHLFTTAVGINLRRQRIALKLQNSVGIFRPGMTIAELASAAGFSDSAHMSRASTDVFGAPPSYFIRNTVIHF